MPALLFGLLIALTGAVFYPISRRRWGPGAMTEAAAYLSEAGPS